MKIELFAVICSLLAAPAPVFNPDVLVVDYSEKFSVFEVSLDSKPSDITTLTFAANWLTFSQCAITFSNTTWQTKMKIVVVPQAQFLCSYNRNNTLQVWVNGPGYTLGGQLYTYSITTLCKPAGFCSSFGDPFIMVY
jgi:hypothetical protein